MINTSFAKTKKALKIYDAKLHNPRQKWYFDLQSEIIKYNHRQCKLQIGKKISSINALSSSLLETRVNPNIVNPLSNIVPLCSTHNRIASP